MDAQFPSWYFDGAQAQVRSSAADDMYACLSDGNKAGYVAALGRWQAASGGLKGCPGALANCPWNPSDTDPNATVVSVDSEGYYCMGGKRLPLLG